MTTPPTQKYWLDVLLDWAEARLPPPQLDECRAVLEQLQQAADAERAACARDVCPRCAAAQMQARKNPVGEWVHAEPGGVTLCRAAGIWERGRLQADR